MTSPAVSNDGVFLLFHETPPLPGAGFVLIPLHDPMLNPSHPGPPAGVQQGPRMPPTHGGEEVPYGI